jgi:hypothetical protein
VTRNCHRCGKKRHCSSWWISLSTGDELIRYLFCTKRCRSASYAELQQSSRSWARAEKLRALALKAGQGNTRATLDFLKELT